MRSILRASAAGLMLSVGMAGAANAADIIVNADITVSTTWTANNTYDLQGQIYVRNMATLTIEAGTVIASTPTVNGSGSLAVTRDANINILGTQTNPVIFTSKNDTATWVNGDPKTGRWRQACNEWGNLTVMGNGFISEDAIGTNMSKPSAGNRANMEGLIAGGAQDQYGGGNDDDDSGTIQFVSFRYGGRVVGLANELNGLSLGGIGRGTDIHHVEIMNNVDDGVEIWGGAVNLKHISVWNVGDDSIDIDQGWRGKAQFILIVQGYSLNASQGSGVGDNCFETDGAENSFYQPLTTGRIANATVIGQPVGGDHGTAWRDNARMQYHNCIFMDLGEQLVRNDNVDGDGGAGYGAAGTHSFLDTWRLPYTYQEPVNAPMAPLTWAGLYQAQESGSLSEIRDSVFFRNNNASAYATATTVGVFNGKSNVLIPGTNNFLAPVANIMRVGPVVRGGLLMFPVVYLDPRPDNQALISVNTVSDAAGFFTPNQYRGAFPPAADPVSGNWLCGWTATEAYGFVPCGGLELGGVGLP